MRVITVGSIEFSWYCLEEILSNKLSEVVGVFNVHPDFSKGISDYRNQKDLAKKYNIPHFWFKNINDSKTVSQIKKLEPELILVFGLSQIIKKDILRIPSIGVLGTHPTLLPKNRGRAPIPWSIIKGLDASGLTFMFLDEGPDTGDIVLQKKWRIGSRDDATSLYYKMIKTGVSMLKIALPSIEKRELTTLKQPKRSNYWPKRVPDDGKIDWSWNIDRIDRLIRASTWPYPGAFSFLNNTKVIIWKAKPSFLKKKGKAGKVISVSKRHFSIMCMRGSLSVYKWSPENIEVKKGDLFM